MSYTSKVLNIVVGTSGTCISGYQRLVVQTSYSRLCTATKVGLDARGWGKQM